MIGSEYRMLFDIVKHIYQANGRKNVNDVLNHLQMVQQYSAIINNRMKLGLDQSKLNCIAYAHDILKEKGLDIHKPNLSWNNHEIPQDLNRYVRLNLDILEKYSLDEYFNTDVSLHALSAGIFLLKEFGLSDAEIMYPICFHSCPVISIYETLPEKTRDMCDVIILADKLASNQQKIKKGHPTVCDLDLITFGQSGNEMNYSLGIYVAMQLKRGESKGEQSRLAVEYYKTRGGLDMFQMEMQKGERKVWPLRSKVLETL